jgi:hypothetical protein
VPRVGDGRVETDARMHRAAFEAQLLPASVGSELLAGYLARHRTGGGPIYGALLLLVAGGVVALPSPGWR